MEVTRNRSAEESSSSSGDLPLDLSLDLSPLTQDIPEVISPQSEDDSVIYMGNRLHAR